MKGMTKDDPSNTLSFRHWNDPEWETCQTKGYAIKLVQAP